LFDVAKVTQAAIFACNNSVDASCDSAAHLNLDRGPSRGDLISLKMIDAVADHITLSLINAWYPQIALTGRKGTLP